MKQPKTEKTLVYTRSFVNDGLKDLHYAAKTGDCKRVQKLLDDNFDKDVRDDMYYTPLHWAVNNKIHFDVVKILLDHNADINAITSNKQTPLHLAVSNTEKSFETVVLMIDAGADVTIPDWFNRTVLHLVLLRNLSNKWVETIINAGADVNAIDSDGHTPLHYAAFYDQTHSINALIKAGAKPNIQDNNDKTPYDIAKRQNNAIIQMKLMMFEK